MPVFSRKGIDCPQCAEFKTCVKMEGAAHLQRTLCHMENAVSLGILRDVGKEADPAWGNSLALPFARRHLSRQCVVGAGGALIAAA